MDDSSLYPTPKREGEVEGRQKESGGKWGEEWRRRGGKTFLPAFLSLRLFLSSLMNPWVGEGGGGIFEW